MAQVTLNASEAVFIDENSATTNFEGTAPQLDVGESNIGSEKRRSLIQFDLSSIPGGSTITGATFKIYLSSASLASNNRTMSAYRLLRNWVENQATWNVYSTGNSWGTAGASNTSTDRESSALGTIAMATSDSAGYKTSTFNTTLVQGWLDGTLTNNGLILVIATESNDMYRFDGEADSNPPQLVIDYIPPASGGPMFFHGGLALG